MKFEDFAKKEITNRDDYLYLKKMLINYPDIFPNGILTDLDNDQVSQLKEEMRDKKSIKEIIKEVRKVDKKTNGYKGTGKIIEDPSAKPKNGLKKTKVKKKDEGGSGGFA